MHRKRGTAPQSIGGRIGEEGAKKERQNVMAGAICIGPPVKESGGTEDEGQCLGRRDHQGLTEGKDTSEASVEVKTLPVGSGL